MKDLKEITIKVKVEEAEKFTIHKLLHRFGVNVPSGCLDGFCGVCRCSKPIDGKTKYKEEKYPIGQVDADENNIPTEILTCISQVDTSDNSTIDKNGDYKLSFLVPKAMLKNINKPLNVKRKSNKL